jgi:hypothetical protein
MYIALRPLGSDAYLAVPAWLRLSLDLLLIVLPITRSINAGVNVQTALASSASQQFKCICRRRMRSRIRLLSGPMIIELMTGSHSLHTIYSRSVRGRPFGEEPPAAELRRAAWGLYARTSQNSNKATPRARSPPAPDHRPRSPTRARAPPVLMFTAPAGVAEL